MSSSRILCISAIVVAGIELSVDAGREQPAVCQEDGPLADAVGLVQLQMAATHPHIFFSRNSSAQIEHRISSGLRSWEKSFGAFFSSGIAYRLGVLEDNKPAPQNKTTTLQTGLPFRLNARLHLSKWVSIGLCIAGTVMLFVPCAGLCCPAHLCPHVEYRDVKSKRWSITVVAILFSLFSFNADFAFNTGQMSSDLGGSFAQVITNPVAFIINSLVGLSWGVTSDHVGRRKVILLCSIIHIIGLLACCFADNFLWFQISSGVQGFGQRGLFVVPGIIRDLFHDAEERAQVNACAMTAIGVGTIISPAVGGALGSWLGWRMPFLIVAVAMGVTFLLMCFLLDETLVIDYSKDREYWAEVKDFFGQYQVYPLILCPTIAFGLLTFCLSSLPVLLEEGFHFSVVQVSIALGVLGLMCLISGGFTSVLQQSYGVHDTLYAGQWFALLSAIVFLVVGLTLTHSLWTLLAVQLLYMLTFQIFRISAETVYLQPLKECYGFASAVNTMCQLTLGSLLVAVPGTGLISCYNGGTDFEKTKHRVFAYCIWYAILLALGFCLFWAMFLLSPPKFAAQLGQKFKVQKMKQDRHQSHHAAKA